MWARVLPISVCACIILFPCIPLRSGTLFFSNDWLNHLWLIGYGAEAVRKHHFPPLVLTASELGGLPYPIFYGYLFYPILNVLAAVVGLRTAVRLAVVGVLALQYALVHRAARSGGASNLLATATAALVTWAIYPLTNLYHRGALTEFFAGAFLTCAVCRWFSFLDADTPRRRLRAALEVGLLYSLAAGTHPITALYGLCFLIGLSLTIFIRLGMSIHRPIRGRLCALVPAAGLTTLLLAPWAYVCVEFNGKLSVQNGKVWLFENDIDCWWVRLFPFPLDVRVWRNPPGLVETPYLDAQVNMPLAILAAVVIWGTIRVQRKAGLWLALAIGLGVMSLWLSLRLEPYDVLPGVFRVVQFSYRMVTYVNLALLVAVLLALRVVPSHPHMAGWLSPRVWTAILACVVTLSAVGLLMKLTTIRAEIPAQRFDYRRFTIYFYGWATYATPGQYSALRADEEANLKLVPLKVAADDPHQYAPTEVLAAQREYIATQVQAFPWNHFYLNGERVPDTELRVWQGRRSDLPGTDWSRGPYLAVPIPAGASTLEYRFEPDPVWHALYRVSFVILLLGLGIVGFLHLRCVSRPPIEKLPAQ